jgi:hypothetical protein
MISAGFFSISPLPCGCLASRSPKHLQILKMLSSSLRRNILADPIEDLAMNASRRHHVSMIRLKPLPDDVAVLDQSHVFRGARLILGYVAEHGPIPLTPSKAFKRSRVLGSRIHDPPTPVLLT